LILATDNEGRTVFFETVKIHDLENFHGIFNLGKRNITTEELYKLF
jgi:hypothetical protein